MSKIVIDKEVYDLVLRMLETATLEANSFCEDCCNDYEKCTEALNLAKILLDGIDFIIPVS